MEEEKNNGEEMPVVLGSDNLVKMAEFAEKRVDAINRIKRAALRVTNARDWTNQNGNPYLQVSGAEKVARLFGISWRIDEPKLVEYDDGHFGFSYKGYFTLGVATIEFEGSRGSKDGFFSKAHGEDIPPSEIDQNDVKKAALTNTIGNGVTRILGIRNLSWEDLKDAGIDVSKMAKVDYKKKEMSKDVKDQRDNIGEMIMKMVGGKKEEASKMLEDLTSFTAKDGKEVKGKKSLADLSEKAVPVTYRKVKEEYEKWQKANKKSGKNSSKKEEPVKEEAEYEQSSLA
jgi:hypothetical protein